MKNKAFIDIARHFAQQGLAVPCVYAHSKDFSCYIQQDLGDLTLYRAVEEGREKGSYSPEEKHCCIKPWKPCPPYNLKVPGDSDFSVCYPQPDFDQRMVSFDLNYFKYCFLKATGLDFSEIRLENDFQTCPGFFTKHIRYFSVQRFPGQKCNARRWDTLFY